MVVSEIGEMWSPHTAPDKIAATLKTSILLYPKIAIAIGIRIPKVPHEVPVEKASPRAIRKNRNGIREPINAFAFTSVLTNPPIFKYSSLQIPDKVHARQRIIIAEVIALNPFTKQSQNSVKVMIFLGI